MELDRGLFVGETRCRKYHASPSLDPCIVKHEWGSKDNIHARRNDGHLEITMRLTTLS
jgi:hypothetical protein